MQETITKPKLHPAEKYLRNPDNPCTLQIRYLSQKRRLFINDRNGTIYLFKKGSRKRGFPFNDFKGISKVYFSEDKKTIHPGK